MNATGGEPLRPERFAHAPARPEDARPGAAAEEARARLGCGSSS